MSLLQELTESEIPKDVNVLCRIFPEGIADKAFPAASLAGLCNVKVNHPENKDKPVVSGYAGTGIERLHALNFFLFC
ncbi:MAG: hypothetical protein GXP46_03205 [Deferribacteres bacterium]|nr:hypothetical protein [Deferribacteres bacterium]